jgi:osmoprotectant transport system substrate-binding protein
MAITRRGVLGAAAVAAALTVGLAGCSNSSTIGGTASSSSSASGSAASGDAKSITVGSANFGESEILAYIYGGALADKGYKVDYNVNIGARTAYLGALKGGQINLVPEYSGALLNYLDPSATAATAADQTTAIQGKISAINAKVFDLAPGADSDSINVTAATASKYKLTSIADLSKAGSVTVAANPEAAASNGWFPKLVKAYGLKNLKFKAINDGGGKTTVSALTSGQVQAADIYSTTPSITANKLVTLTDPKNVFAAQQIVPVVSADKATSAVGDIVNPVSAKLTTSELLALNTTANGSAKPDYQTIAKDWLSKNGFGSADRQQGRHPTRVPALLRVGLRLTGARGGGAASSRPRRPAGTRPRRRGPASPRSGAPAPAPGSSPRPPARPRRRSRPTRRRRVRSRRGTGGTGSGSRRR